MKQIRTFFNYLKNEKHYNTGDFHKLLYVRKEEVDILVLSPEQLKFLIHDQEFQMLLTPAEKKNKRHFCVWVYYRFAIFGYLFVD